MLEIPGDMLARWAASKPSIKALCIFGSYARGEARPDSDLDIALDFTGVGQADAELITNRAAWKAELTRLTGTPVNDIYHCADSVVRDGPTVIVFMRDLP
jgi:predicted nucleotidyltransferase